MYVMTITFDSLDIYVPFCILCTINIIILLVFSFYIMKITNQIIFLNSIETSRLIVNDMDDYYKTFNELDFKVRNVSNTNEYKKIIKKSTDNFSWKEKIKVYLCVTLIQNQYYLKKIFNKNFKHSKVIDKIINDPWKFGLIQDNKYENGLPHTRLDTIIISRKHLSEFSLYRLQKLFIHEKVHTFQKLYPRVTHKFIENLGFKNVELKSSYNSNNKNNKIRANPDINEYVYMDNKKRLMLATYTNAPHKITDINYSFDSKTKQSSEHPYEKMAIDISNLIM